LWNVGRGARRGSRESDKENRRDAVDRERNVGSVRRRRGKREGREKEARLEGGLLREGRSGELRSVCDAKRDAELRT
jgi:hypothetical protein